MTDLTIWTNSDAEIFVMDHALNPVGRAVGVFQQDLPVGLYKIRINRAGTLDEHLIELGTKAQELYRYVNQFAAIAPIGPMLADSPAIEALGRAALADCSAPGILVLAHQNAMAADHTKPFGGTTIFPWRGTRHATALDKSQRSVVVAGELWSAVALQATAADGPFVLELTNGPRVSRQMLLVAEGWQTRVFLRGAVPAPSGGAPFDVSVQMAPPWANVVYDDHLVTVEVARNALERGRAIFTGANLVNDLLQGKYENPIAGLTGLHLLLDAKERADLGDRNYDQAASLPVTDSQRIADEVLINLTRLLYPQRVAALQAQGLTGAALDEGLLYPDPDWPESSDLTALRVRAKRCRAQVFIPSPPMFRVSWDVLKSHAARDGLVWISKQLWMGTGAAGIAGPYLAWAPGRHSVKTTMQRLGAQHIRMAQPRALTAATIGLEGAAAAQVNDSEGASPPSGIEAVMSGTADTLTQQNIAASFGLPLSIFEAPRPKASATRQVFSTATEAPLRSR